MIQFLKKYKAFLFGFIIVVPLFFFLDFIGFIILPEDRSYEIVIYSIFWGLVIALPIHYFEYLKRKKKTSFRVLGLILLFISTLIIDSNMDMPDNPITFVLLMSFWLGLVYLLVPTFLKKYWKLVVFFYGPLFLYFVYLRLFSGNLEAYLLIKEDFPFVLFFLPIPIFFVMWVYEQWKWFQTLKAEKANAELSTLQAQINPHFFFNTLNNLYALTIKQSEKAPEVILKLSEMMRYTIYEGKKDRVPVKDELEYLSNYIELHKIRYKNKVDIQFTNEIDANVEVAPLLFIILLENAFKHGLENNHENGFIHLDLKGNTEEIQFTIKNNLEDTEPNAIAGIGLENLKRRLDLMYPNKYEFVNSKENTAYIVDLKIELK